LLKLVNVKNDAENQVSKENCTYGLHFVQTFEMLDDRIAFSKYNRYNKECLLCHFHMGKIYQRNTKFFEQIKGSDKLYN